MKWPFMLRSTHSALLGAMQACQDANLEAIGVLKGVIKDRDEQIESLTHILTSEKCNDYTRKVPEKSKSGDPVAFGRAGWRARAQMASDATIPPPSDSIKKLEERVKKEGGTV